MASILLVPCQLKLLKKHRLHRHCHTKTTLSNSLHSVSRNDKIFSFRYKSTANAPLFELPGASFDQYMDNKHRVLQVIFPDKGGTTKQLNEEEWRVKFPPIESLFLNVQPTADVRFTFKSNGEDYPHDIPHHITQILEFHFIRWEFQRVNTSDTEPYHLNLDVRGAIYPERRGKHSWLKNQMEMKISFGVSPTMALVPENILEGALELMFKTMLDGMKQELHGKLLADYSKFKRIQSKKNSV